MSGDEDSSTNEPLLSSVAVVHELKPMDQKRFYENKRTEGLKRNISISCWSVVVFALGSVAIIGVVLLISATLAPERKVFLGTIMIVVVLVLIILLFICRKDYEALVIYIPILAGASGLCLGLSIWYL